ncbi:hypothetical protein SH1V18_38560 [Vallitalea longa]|uniref:Flp pilus assembly protein TadB n=1 Tax=Vallitalea longa TaxID=2936439 RepID=A0A9W5YES5_9FIRM|nr:hypothetical protein [Vallitalea longa]GKX31376.1 hypothetical protein SH1V18_38560 [Vallitalea longa]
MTILLTIALTGLITGCFILLELSPYQLIENLSKHFNNKPLTIKQKILKVQVKKKQKGLKKFIAETIDILEMTNKKNRFATLCILSLVLFILGTLLSISMSNMIMIPVLSIGMALIPFWYIKFTAAFYKKQLNSELETALSVITNSYLRNENIITAVEENIDYINPPVRDVFKSFLSQTKLINSNVNIALEGIKTKIDNDVFKEWVDGLISCRDDKNLKHTLSPIVAKLSDMRVVGAELEYLMYEPVKEFITLVILLLGNIPLMYFLNKSWYRTLVHTAIGKTVLSITVLAIFISLNAVIKLSKPVEYKS